MKIAIIGCGFAGLSTALFLAKQYKQVDIYDKFKTAHPIGAGIMLQPSSIPILNMLEMQNTLEHNGEKIYSIEGINHQEKRVFLTSYQDYEPNAYGIGIERSSVFQDLYQKAQNSSYINMILGQEVTHIEQLRKTYDLVIIANGSHSVLRNQFPIRQKYRVYPYGCIWTTIENDNESKSQLSQYVKYSEEMFGILPSGTRSNQRILSVFWSLPITQECCYNKNSILEKMAKYNISQNVLHSISQANFSFAKYADVYLKHYHYKNVVVIGDAAHGMSPQLGQGANMAFLDAYYLSSLLSNSNSHNFNLEETLKNYSQLRKPHLDFYTQASKFLTPLYQSDNQLYGYLRDKLFLLAQTNEFSKKLSASVLCGKRQSWFKNTEINYNFKK